MQLEALKIFCDVVRTASFSRGAAENGVSQSSASHAVHELEKRLGVKLIDRSKRPLVLTPHGRVYFEGCRNLVDRYFEVENRVKALENAHNVVGTVRVAAIYSVGLHHMAQYVDRFHAEYPGADVRIEYQHPTEVLASVRGGDAELGLLSFPRKWTDLTVLPWREEPMVLAVRPDHPLAGREAVTVAELDGRKLVRFDSGLHIRRAVDRFLRKHGVQVEPGPEFDNIENIKRAVEELPGSAAILPEPTLQREVAARSLVAIPFLNVALVRPLAIIHRRSGGELGLTATRFLRLLTGQVGEADEPPAATHGSWLRVVSRPT
jgi:DNA-binding transcriptional LysR family regulator